LRPPIIELLAGQGLNPVHRSDADKSAEGGKLFLASRPRLG
jgi:hypothetical protein